MPRKAPPAVGLYIAETERKGGRSKTISPDQRRAKARRARGQSQQKVPGRGARRRKSIWDLVRELAAGIPESELRNLPADGSSQLDHYLYGAPKRNP